MSQQPVVTLERVAWELEQLTISIMEASKDRKELAIQVRGFEKQLDSCLTTVNVINDRLKDIVMFMHKSDDSQIALSQRITLLEQQDRERNLREETIKSTLVTADVAREQKQTKFRNNMKTLATVQGIVFVGMEIWHHLSK